MARVNLLPQELRVGLGIKRNLFYPMLFLIVFSVLGGLFLNMYTEINRQEARTTELNAAIAALEPVRIQRETLIRLEAELSGVRNEMTRRIEWSAYTDELAARLPTGGHRPRPPLGRAAHRPFGDGRQHDAGGAVHQQLRRFEPLQRTASWPDDHRGRTG